jgi:hypothetical protein
LLDSQSDCEQTIFPRGDKPCKCDRRAKSEQLERHGSADQQDDAPQSALLDVCDA